MYDNKNIRKLSATCRTPTSGAEGTSPKIWIETVDIAIDSGLKLGFTQRRET